jgi:hypothetical protein
LEKDVKIKGVGEFGVESYQLFCRDQRIVPGDRNLRAFAAWRASVSAVKPEPVVKDEPVVKEELLVKDEPRA